MPTRFPWKLFSRIVGIQAVSLLLALGASGIAARYFFRQEFLSQVASQLRLSLGSLSRDLPEPVPLGWCAAHSFDPAQRLTVIDETGKVICDSHHDARAMENHLSRPEVRDALASGFGHSERRSATLSENMLYGALHVRGVVLRGSIPLDNLIAALSVFDTSLLLFLVTVGLALLGFAFWSGRRLAFPIGRLLHKARTAAAREDAGAGSDAYGDEPYGELSELESNLDHIQRDLEEKAASLDREREEHATLMRSISDAILAVDSDGAPLFYNSRFAVLFDQDAALRFRQARLWELFRDPDVLQAFRGALKNGEAGTVSAVAHGPGGAEKFFSLSVSPLRRGAAGDVYGAVGVFHDVSELKRAEQLRIDFVANVSHELRTPLTAIKGYTDTLSDDLRAGRAVTPDFVEVIRRNSERLMSLINDLLDLSSLESNADELQRSEIPTRDFSERVIQQLSARTQAKGQRVELSSGAVSVFADPRRLEQVLVNLMDNASKYTPSGGRLRVEWADASGKGTFLRVSDTGPGIAPEHHARLFERFYRVDKARSRELGGTGLGLAIVKHILQRHGGTVRVESRMGEGSQFECFFPAEA